MNTQHDSLIQRTEETVQGKGREGGGGDENAGRWERMKRGSGMKDRVERSRGNVDLTIAKDALVRLVVSYIGQSGGSLTFFWVLTKAKLLLVNTWYDIVQISLGQFSTNVSYTNIVDIRRNVYFTISFSLVIMREDDDTHDSVEYVLIWRWLGVQSHCLHGWCVTLPWVIWVWRC